MVKKDVLVGYDVVSTVVPIYEDMTVQDGYEDITHTISEGTLRFFFEAWQDGKLKEALVGRFGPDVLRRVVVVGGALMTVASLLMMCVAPPIPTPTPTVTATATMTTTPTPSPTPTPTPLPSGWRAITVDGETVVYNYNEIISPSSLDDLQHQSEISVAVRLLIGEMGAEQIVNNQRSLEAAAGILYVVHNRVAVASSDPWAFSGCATLTECATATDQFAGINSGLNLAASQPSEYLDPAIEAMVEAYYRVENKTLAEQRPDEPARYYLHLCGGPDNYGGDTTLCSGDNADVYQHQGPIAFWSDFNFNVPPLYCVDYQPNIEYADNPNNLCP